MAANRRSPTVRHRRLTRLLRQFRENAGLTREQAAAQLEGWHGSRITRYETGVWTRIQPRDLRALLEVYGITGKAEQDEYVELCRQAGQPGWWTQYKLSGIGSYIGFEDDASIIQAWEPLYIPGLLQTEDYARALISSNPNVGEEELERRLALRVERKKILERSDAPELWAVIDEAAIRRPIGDGEVVRDQLIHLAEVTSQYVNLQVVPFSAGPHPGMDGSFALLDFPNPLDPSIVYLETSTEELYLEEPEQVARYRLMFNHLRARALGPPESMKFLREAAGM